MKKIDPSFVMILIAMFVIAKVLNVPLLVMGIAAYFVYRIRKKKLNASGEDDRSRPDERDRRYRESMNRRERQPAHRSMHKPAERKNPFKESGIKKFKDYDYDGAIEDFDKALAVNPADVSVHFNLACAYSLTEQKERAFHHLTAAVENGFKDFEKINQHDALAYLRVQDEFEDFVENGYRTNTTKAALHEAKMAPVEGKLLEQLNQLARLREKGLLTAEEFEVQKKKLLD